MSVVQSSPTRRDFVLTSAAAMGIAALPAASYARVPGANDRLQIGLIGCGPYTIVDLYLFIWLRRTSHLCSVTHVCDVFAPHRETAAQKTGGEPTEDYRRILDDPGVDAVIIATPDHWHARMAIDAAEAGKDIYLEAPMTRTWQEAVDLHDAVKRNQVVFQCGAQLASDDRYHQAAQLVKAGAIGQVLFLQTMVSYNSRVGFYNRRIWNDISDETLNWNAWLGNAPKRPLDPERFVRWRKFWDYSGGVPTNLLFNSIAANLIAMGTSFPRRVASGGGRYLPTSGETPDTYFTTIDYEGFSMNITSCLGNELAWPTTIYGHEGSIRFQESLEMVRERYFVAEFKKREEQGLFNVVPTARPDHVRNWLECIRTREKPVCNEDVALSAMVAAHLGEMSFRDQRVYSFDGGKRVATTS